jgi:hypothetical protein
MSRAIRITASLLLVACAGAAAGESPSQLRAEIAKAEKDYIELYNKTNTNPQFEIVCRNEKPTGTNFTQRICRPRYVLDALQASASESVQRAINSSATSSSGNSGGPNVGALPAGGGEASSQADKDTAFKQNILDAQLKSPELLALGKKRDELQKQLDAATKN